MTMRCRVCDCSEREPCNPPCSWQQSGLCSTCHEMIVLLREWIAAALHPHTGRLVREARDL